MKCQTQQREEFHLYYQLSISWAEANLIMNFYNCLLVINNCFIAMKDYKNNKSQYQNTQETQIYKVATQPMTWKDLHLKPELLKVIRQMKYEMPTQVQKCALPALLKQKDLIYQARSGTGKTLVFVIGILNSITLQKNGEYQPHQCLVIAHTRELAYQIYQQFKKHAKYLSNPQLRCACVFGGQQVQKDIQMLCDKNKSPHIIVATMGRLLDLIQRGRINIKSFKYLVIDQCDYILKDAKEHYLPLIMAKLSKKTQKIMLSATIDESVIQFCKKLMENQNPQIIRIDQGKLSLAGLHHFYTIVQQKNKFMLLQNLLDGVPFDQAIIFVNRIERVTMLSDLLDQLLFNPIRIHSRLSQKERISCYEKFKENESRVLVATNLFGRGIDIVRVNLVINYDLPFDKQTYVHRVGRAGRFYRKGIVINFVRDQPEQNGKSDGQVLDMFRKDLDQKLVKLPKNFDGTGFI